MTTITATIGTTMDNIESTMAVTVSTVDTTGFANPAVVAVEAIRVAPEVPEIAAAVPPPAMIANAQVTSGLKSATVDTITAVPAIAANGTAMVSKRLST